MPLQKPSSTVERIVVRYAQTVRKVKHLRRNVRGLQRALESERLLSSNLAQELGEQRRRNHDLTKEVQLLRFQEWTSYSPLKKWWKRLTRKA